MNLAYADPPYVNCANQILGCDPDDNLCDIFPGSGAVTKHWNDWKLELINKQIAPAPLTKGRGSV